MRQYVDNRLLWLLAAGSLVAVCYRVRKVLLLNPLPLAPSDDDLDIDSKLPPRRLRCDENTLKLSTLRTLAFGPTFELRDLARKIVFDRFLASDSTQLLAKDLASTDDARRNQAVDAIWAMYTTDDTRSDLIALFLIPNVDAIVDALVNILPLHERHAAQFPSNGSFPPSPVKPAYRPPTETELIQILYGVLSFTPDHGGKAGAVKAGVITRWLAKYPFPCSRENGANYTRWDVVSLLTNSSTDWSSDDEDMANVVRSLFSLTAGEEEFYECGLDKRSRRPRYETFGSRRGRFARRGGLNHFSQIHRHPASPPSTTSSSSRSSYNSDDDFIELMHRHERINPLENLDLPADWEIQGPRTRPREGPERSREEEQLRRRHREAVVVAERGAPLGPENILERRDTEPEFGDQESTVEQRESEPALESTLDPPPPDLPQPYAATLPAPPDIAAAPPTPAQLDLQHQLQLLRQQRLRRQQIRSDARAILHVPVEELTELQRGGREAVLAGHLDDLDNDDDLEAEAAAPVAMDEGLVALLRGQSDVMERITLT